MLPFLVGKYEKRQGAVTKRLCTGLQIRLARFDSGPRLHQVVVISPRNGDFLFDNRRSVLVFGLSGEIGRHSGLKIRRFVNSGRTGSIPVSGTTPPRPEPPIG
jgi:hypothetical protein